MSSSRDVRTEILRSKSTNSNTRTCTGQTKSQCRGKHVQVGDNTGSGQFRVGSVRRRVPARGHCTFGCEDTAQFDTWRDNSHDASKGEKLMKRLLGHGDSESRVWILSSVGVRQTRAVPNRDLSDVESYAQFSSLLTTARHEQFCSCRFVLQWKIAQQSFLFSQNDIKLAFIVANCKLCLTCIKF